MTLAAEAQELLRQGRVPEAERAFERILTADPHNVEALNVVALVALRNGNLESAFELLTRACAADSNDPVTQHHLGQVLLASGQYASAITAQTNALIRKPEFFVARLFLAASLERAGQTERAVVAYARAMQDAQRSGRWLNPATTPASLKPMVEHAVVFVRHGRRAAFARIFEPVVSRYGRESIRRIEKCLRIYFNEEEAVRSDPRQQPTFLYFPGLPTSAYLDRGMLPWADALEAATEGIRGELLNVMGSADGRERVFTSSALEEANLRGSEQAPTWTGYYFYRYGIRRPENCDRCPRTIEALDALPLSHVRDHGPEALYSVFTTGTHLLPHRGVTNTRLVGHLPLIVPEECALNVGGELHRWREGKVVVFDDTFEHEAWNRSKHIRVVMIFDIWNPYLTPAEQAALADLIADIGDFRHGVEAD